MATEKRLIDANDLLEKHTCDVYGAYDDSCMLQAVFVPYIKGAPTVDAVEVVHGRWDVGRYIFPDGSIAVRCTECGCSITKEEYNEYIWNYCPVCGAKMDGERSTDG